MAKITTMQVPAAYRKTGKVTTREVFGTVAWFTIAGKRTKFFLQRPERNAPADTLTHFETGFKFGNLNEIKIRYMATRGNYARMTDRQAAAMLIDGVLASLGEERVLAAIEQAHKQLEAIARCSA
jgi:hypothetical protein